MANICRNTVTIINVGDRSQDILSFLDPKTNEEQVIGIMKTGMAEFRMYLEGFSLEEKADRVIWCFESAWGPNQEGIQELSKAEPLKECTLILKAQTEGDNSVTIGSFKNGETLGTGENSPFMQKLEEKKSILARADDGDYPEEAEMDVEPKLEEIESLIGYYKLFTNGCLESIEDIDDSSGIIYGDFESIDSEVSEENFLDILEEKLDDLEEYMSGTDF